MKIRCLRQDWIWLSKHQSASDMFKIRVAGSYSIIKQQWHQSAITASFQVVYHLCSYPQKQHVTMRTDILYALGYPGRSHITNSRCKIWIQTHAFFHGLHFHLAMALPASFTFSTMRQRTWHHFTLLSRFSSEQAKRFTSVFMQEFLDEKPAPILDKCDDLFGAILQHVDKNKKQLYLSATIMTCFDHYHHHLHV